MTGSQAAPRREIRSVIIEADGGSRGNPGPSAYGALLKDADTGEVLAEDGTTIGETTNNVAEYAGLIAGLKLAAEFAPEADIEVRMDSKLVVEQMSGRWKVKHPSMRPLAVEASRLTPFGTTFTWVPREQNKHADRLANEALDGLRHGVSVGRRPQPAPETDERPERPPGTAPSPPRGWAHPDAHPTTLVLMRHGATRHTMEKRFSGGLESANPGLSDEGRDQVRATADWLSPLAEQIDVVVSSPVRRTRESADLVAERLGLGVVEEGGFAEMNFGLWDGLTFAEVADRHPDDLEEWLGSLDVAPGGGESFRVVERRVRKARDRVLQAYPGKTVLVVSHVTPIKTLLAHALEAPLRSVYRMELAPASVSVVSYFVGGQDARQPMATMRLFNARPTDEPLLH